MESKINEGLLCVLVKNTDKNGVTIDIDYREYENPLFNELQGLSNLCDNAGSSLYDIIVYIERTVAFNVLATEFNYCEELNKSYQTVTVKNEKMINEINKWQEIIDKRKELDEYYNVSEAVRKCKSRIKTEYTKGCKAFAMEQAFRTCKNNNNTITFSHRKCGWSQPVYQLTPNFSVEVKTNFGYGRSSYFYNKLTFKGVEIVPFSEWVQYEKAKMSEIVRYSKKFPLENEAWKDALEYCKEACNLSLKSEEDFVSKYLIDECEVMINGLEKLLVEDSVFVKIDDKHHGFHQVDKSGNYLVEYKGEKISGALGFISKILSLDSVVVVKDFIKRIEICNVTIQKALEQELIYVKKEIQRCELEFNALKPKVQQMTSENASYSKKKYQMRIDYTVAGGLDIKNINENAFEQEFQKKFPEYNAFKEQLSNVFRMYYNLSDSIRNLSESMQNMMLYNKRIKEYFS